MRLIHIIFLLLAMVFGLLLYLLLVGGPESPTGMAHPRIDGMSIGGDGQARLGGAGWLVALIQGLTLLLIYALIALGVSRRHRTPGFWVLLGIGCALSLAVWWMLYSSYLSYLATGTTDTVFGFPRPTAFMLFGVFLGGSYLCALYILGFRRFIYSHADEAEYEALRAETGIARLPERSAVEKDGEEDG